MTGNIKHKKFNKNERIVRVRQINSDLTEDMKKFLKKTDVFVVQDVRPNKKIDIGYKIEIDGQMVPFYFNPDIFDKESNVSGTEYSEI